MKALWILGAGGHGKVVAEAACDLDRWSEIRFLDDQYPKVKRVGSWSVVGKIASLAQSNGQALPAVGNNTTRLRWIHQIERLGLELPVVIDPTASCSRFVRLGAGTVVIAHARINIDAELGMGCIVNTGATVGHDCTLGSGVHVCPGANLGGGTIVGDRTWIGIGATVCQEVKIGADVVVGAGAVVVRDIPDGVTVVGNPAKPIERGTNEHNDNRAANLSLRAPHVEAGADVCGRTHRISTEPSSQSI